jgi:xylulokinase
LAHCCLSPSLVGLDSRHEPLTPIITHQDRRSLAQARWVQKRVGTSGFLAITGNLPVPGGISCTSMLWLKRNRPGVYRRVHTFGHLNTYLACRLTGQRVIDPSNASFTGLYETTTLGGWSAALCRRLGIDASVLPEVRPANAIAGRLSSAAARSLHLPAGMPVLTGITDTSAAMLAAGAVPGQLLHAIGTTSVLAVITDRPHPHPKRLTRAVGVDRKWVAVATIAAGTATFDWLHRTLFAHLSERQFQKLVARLSQRPHPTTVRFETYLAGDRMSIAQRRGSISGLTLATHPNEILQAAIRALAGQTAEGLKQLERFVRADRPVIVVGGAAGLARTLHALWPGRWRFRTVSNATLLGLARLAEMSGK